MYKGSNLDELYCSNKKCRPKGHRHKWGVLIREASSRLADALGLMELRCEKCGQRYVINTRADWPGERAA